MDPSSAQTRPGRLTAATEGRAPTTAPTRVGEDGERGDSVRHGWWCPDPARSDRGGQLHGSGAAHTRGGWRGQCGANDSVREKEKRECGSRAEGENARTLSYDLHKSTTAGTEQQGQRVGSEVLRRDAVAR
jgi:hypothetical protein